jgi:chorismate-pyruvate lyase
MRTAQLTLRVAVALLLSSCATTSSVDCRNVEALAHLQTLNSELLASSSATQTLERWCSEHGMAADPKIVAVRIAAPPKAPSEEQRQRLGVSSAEEVRYRHVELRCGTHVFSEADNWYVPSRLTSEMNGLLETTDTPFGRVVRPLQPYRRTLSATLLWSPLGHQPMPRHVLEHRAVLYTADHQPFAEVVERYRGEVLAFSGPKE